MRFTRTMRLAHAAHVRWNLIAKRLAPRDAFTKKPLSRGGPVFLFVWSVNDWLADRWVPAWIEHSIYGLDGLYEKLMSPPPEGDLPWDDQ